MNDLARDPREFQNLYHDARMAAIKTDMLEAVAGLLIGRAPLGILKDEESA